MAIINSALLDWAVGRWKAEVEHRPLNNIHRRSSDDACHQVMVFAGLNNPSARVGPSHDELLAQQKDRN